MSNRMKWLAYAVCAGLIVPAIVTAQATTGSAGSTASTGSTGGTVTCKDGTISKSTGSGTCSSHGGMATPSNAMTTSGASGAAAANSGGNTKSVTSNSPKTWDDHNPNGAIAKCKDGTYWHSMSRSGACSGRGGVDSWLQTQTGNSAGASKSQAHP
jgi:hypothetical protein